MTRTRRNPEFRPLPFGKQPAGYDTSVPGGLHAYLVETDLVDAHRDGANLRGKDLSFMDMVEADLQGADLCDANLRGSDLSRADLTRAQLDGADLSNAVLSGASLLNASLNEAKLAGANFSNALLTGATFIGADLTGVDFTGADLTNADFTDAIGLDRARRNPRSSGAAMTRSRRNPDATFTVFHADHGVSPAQMDFIKATLAHEAPQGFFIKEIMLPRSLGMARNALYGPAAGDAPVAESAVSYRPRGDRPWSDRVVSWPTRPTDRVQAIGIREGDSFKLFTVYGGYLAPQHPDDPANPNVEAAKRFWSQHALSIEQWDAPGAAKRNPRSSGAPMIRSRRNPALRRNPLLSWSNTFRGKPGAAHYYFAPMLKEGAEKKFRDGVAHVDRLAQSRGLLPLRLSFMLAPNNERNPDFYKKASDEGRKHKSVVLVDFVHPPEVFDKGKPGDPTRETSHTFFNGLHRLCELLTVGLAYKVKGDNKDPFARIYAKNFNGDITKFSFVDPRLYAQYDKAVREVVACVDDMVRESRGAITSDKAWICLFSSGVDTAAGRLNALNDPDQLLADMFAKFCVSKDNWIVDPDVLLCEALLPADLVERIKRLRSRMAKYLALVVVNMYATFAGFVDAYYGVSKSVAGTRSKGLEVKVEEDMRQYFKRRFAAMKRDIPLVPFTYAEGREDASVKVEDSTDFFLGQQYLVFLPYGPYTEYDRALHQLVNTAPALVYADADEDMTGRAWRGSSDEDGGSEDSTALRFYKVDAVKSAPITKVQPGLWAEYVTVDEGEAFSEEQLHTMQSTVRPSPFGKQLGGKDLRGHDLSQFDLRGAYLGFANLTGVNLSGADLTGADLTGAKLKGTNFAGANLADVTGLSEKALKDVVGLDTAKRNPRSSGAPMIRSRRNPALRPSPFGEDLAGKDLSNEDLSYMDLKGADLSGADLNFANLLNSSLIGANLSRADLNVASLSGADLRRANFNNARLYDANLSFAYLSFANLKSAYLSFADLRGANINDANLSYANLSYANLTNANLYGADLRGADLTGANLSGATLTNAKLEGVVGLHRARRNPRSSGAAMTRSRLSPALRPSPYGKDLFKRDLSGQDLSDMNFSDANFSYADLSGANLSGASLYNANLYATKLVKAGLSFANLTYAHLREADLSGAGLSFANLKRARLSDANLSGANLSGADLNDANLRGADLTNANLSNANLTDANLSEADLNGANLSNANLTDANVYRTNLTGANVEGVIGIDLDTAKRKPRSSKTLVVRSRRNPFFVSPGGAAAKVSDADFAARKFPRLLEREVEIEGFDPNNLPPGFTVQKEGGRYHVFFQGRDTGLYAMDPRKAAEIVSRKGANVASGTAPKAAAGRPSGVPSDRPLFGVDRDTLTPHSRAGDLAAAEELRLRGRDPMTGAKVSGLASRFSKAVPNGRTRR